MIRGYTAVTRCRGNRYMGFTRSLPFTNVILNNPAFLLPVPDFWSLEEAATITCVYFTVVYCLISVGKIRKGQSILIHSGAGGIGQAALNIATYYKCNIFATVGTAAKKDFILKTFPEVPAKHIGYSRDASFEQMVLKHTHGKGVDFVLSSLAGEQLITSLRCLASGGKLLEIGKVDAVDNNKLKFEAFSNKCSFHGLMVDKVIEIDAVSIIRSVADCMVNGILDGFVKPLNSTIFSNEEMENAYQYMSKGEHIGKCLIQMRKPELTKEVLHVTPRVSFRGSCSYIIIGGLGGFGLELTRWLIKRCAKKIVLSSRNGIQTEYQNMLIRDWKNRGISIMVVTSDVTKKETCFDVVQLAQTLGPVDGVFNLAVVLKDGHLENQDEQNFRSVLKPKVVITRNFDIITRTFCPKLRYFVVFSSAVSGIGNAGQTNYGFANSMAERICERRKLDGFPALAIQWGIVGDVGIVAENVENKVHTSLGNSVEQPIKSCLKVLESFLLQEEAIVSSMVVTKHGKNQKNTISSVEDIVKSIMGITDLKNVSRYSSLLKLGLDSMASSILKPKLETNFDLSFSIKELRNMTLAKLEELIKDKLIIEEATKSVAVNKT